MVGSLFNRNDDDNEVLATMWNDVGSTRQRWHMEFAGTNALPTSKNLVTDDGGPIKTRPYALLIYPNPASEVLHIELPDGFEESSTTITLANSQGSAIPSHYINSQLDISLLSSGIYFVTVTDGKQILHQKFVKN